MGDDFFTREKCSRCGVRLTVRIMSWFNNDTLCLKCSDKEKEIRKQLPSFGKDYEGCGFIPEVDK